jgi:hypothetical protein
MVSKGVSENSDQGELIGVDRKLARGRNVGEVRVAGHPGELDQDIEAAVGLEPLGPHRLDRGEIEGTAVELAALDGEEDRRRVRVAEHLLDVEAERIAHDLWHVGVTRTLRGAAEHDGRSARAPLRRATATSHRRARSAHRRHCQSSTTSRAK